MIIPAKVRDDLMKANGLTDPSLFAANLSKHFIVRILYSGGDEHVYIKGQLDHCTFAKDK